MMNHKNINKKIKDKTDRKSDKTGYAKLSPRDPIFPPNSPSQPVLCWEG